MISWSRLWMVSPAYFLSTNRSMFQFVISSNLEIFLKNRHFLVGKKWNKFVLLSIMIFKNRLYLILAVFLRGGQSFYWISPSIQPHSTKYIIQLDYWIQNSSEKNYPKSPTQVKCVCFQCFQFYFLYFTFQMENVQDSKKNQTEH